MSDFYVSSVDGNNGAPPSVVWWNGSHNTYATVQGAIAASGAVAMHNFYVDSAHDFTANADIEWAGPNPHTEQYFIVSVNRTTGNYERGATERTGTGGNFLFQMWGGTYHIKGFELFGTTGAQYGAFWMKGETAMAGYYFEDCIITMSNTNAAHASFPTVAFKCGTQNATGQQFLRIVFDACQILLGQNASNPGIELCGAHVTLKNGTTVGYSGVAKPTTLFTGRPSTASRLIIRDCDLSGYNTTSGAIFALSGPLAAGHHGMDGGGIEVVNTEFSGTPTITSGTWLGFETDWSITFVNVSHGATLYPFRYENKFGLLTLDTGIFANDGAEFDGDGVSWKIVTTAACTEFRPFITPDITRFNSTLSEVDVDIELIRDNAADFTNRQVWAEFEYPADASTGLGEMLDSRNANPYIGTGADLTNSATVWTETLTNDNEMRIRFTPTPLAVGALHARVFVGVASTTLYVDPALRIEGADANPPTFWGIGGAFNSEPQGAGSAGMFFPRAMSGGLV